MTIEIPDPQLDFAILLGIEEQRQEFGDLPFLRTIRYAATDLEYYCIFLRDLVEQYDTYRSYCESNPGTRRVIPNGDLYTEQGGLCLSDGERVWIHPADGIFLGAGHAGWHTLDDNDDGLVELNDDGARVAFRFSADELYFTLIQMGQAEDGTTLRLPTALFESRMREQYDLFSRFAELEAEGAWGLPTTFSQDLVERQGFYYRLMDGLFYTRATWQDDGTILLRKKDKASGLDAETIAPPDGWRFDHYLLKRDLSGWGFQHSHADILTYRWTTVEWYVYLPPEDRVRKY